jgi:hypothetical protein
VEEFKLLREQANVMDEDDDDDDEGVDEGNDMAVVESSTKNEKRIPKGEHYMVFAFQNWSGNSKHIHFVAARYNLKNLSGRWIRKAVRHVICVLASFSIYVNGDAYDGASEKRAWMKRTLHLTPRNLIPELLKEDTANDNNEAEEEAEESPLPQPPLDPTIGKFGPEEIPWDMPVAYDHPSIPGRYIFALADFSHAIKKITNAIEWGNLLGLDGGHEISMRMMKVLYLACDDMNGTPGGIMRYLSYLKRMPRTVCVCHMLLSYTPQLWLNASRRTVNA